MVEVGVPLGEGVRYHHHMTRPARTWVRAAAREQQGTYGTSDGVSGFDGGPGRLMKVGCGDCCAGCDIVSCYRVCVSADILLPFCDRRFPKKPIPTLPEASYEIFQMPVDRCLLC